MDLQLEYCKEAPFYTLGPLTTWTSIEAPGRQKNFSTVAHQRHRRRDDRIGSRRSG